jgi:endonuclease G
VRINFLACLMGLLLTLSGCVLAPPIDSPPSVPTSTPSPSPPPPTSRSIHLRLGNSSNAVADIAQPDNYLMVKPQYALSYNRSKGIPNWVSWQLNSTRLGETEQQNNFRPDPQLPARAVSYGYRKSKLKIGLRNAHVFSQTTANGA